MGSHVEWAEARCVSSAVLSAEDAQEELGPDGVVSGWVLMLDGGNGDGLAIEGELTSLERLLIVALRRVRAARGDGAVADRPVVVIERDPDSDVAISVFAGGGPVSVRPFVVDPGAGWSRSEWVAARDEAVAAATVEARATITAAYDRFMGSEFVTDDTAPGSRVAGPVAAGVRAAAGADVVFYSLPARVVGAGVSTADGQDVLSTHWTGSEVWLQVYTPRSDDPGADAANQMTPEWRICGPDERVGLAVFADTTVDLSAHRDAVVCQ